MKSLVRTKVERFNLENAVTLGRLQELRDNGELESMVLPVDMCFAECPALHVQEKWQKLLENGNSFYASQTRENVTYAAEAWVRIYRADGRFAGIYAFDSERRWYKPVKMFL